MYTPVPQENMKEEEIDSQTTTAADRESSDGENDDNEDSDELEVNYQ